jgi:CHAT domain-containing protein
VNQTGFAQSLALATENERQALLSQHTELVDVNLAWALKAIYDETESSDPARAAEVATALLLLTQVSEDMEVSAIAAWTEGMVLLDGGQMEDAITRLDIANTQFLSLGLPVKAASTQVSKLRALAMLGRFDQALDCGLKARDVFLAHNELLTTGKIEQNLGNLHFMLDRYKKAEQHYRAAHELYEVVGDQKQLAQIDNCLATVLTSQHRFREAEQIYKRAFVTAETAGLEITLAEIEANQGCLALFQGHFDTALEYLERSRRRYSALGLFPRSAVADQELADAYLEMNLASEAEKIYERVIPVYVGLGMKTEQARAMTYAGRARLALGKIYDARSILAEARTLYQEANNPVGEAFVTLVEAQACYAAGNYDAAASLAGRTEAPFAEANSWGRLLLARWIKGDVARLQGKIHMAKGLLESVLRDAKKWAILPVIQRCYISLGLLAREYGDSAEAEIIFRKAVTSIEEVRTPLPAEEFRTAFLADKLVPYSELVRICLADGIPSRVAEALGYVEQARSRALADMMVGALLAFPEPTDGFESGLLARLAALREELNWFYSQINRQSNEDASRSATILSELYDAVHERETAISEIILQVRQATATLPVQMRPFDIVSLKNDLGADTALVEYFSLDGELLVFVVTDECIEVMQLPGTESEVEAELKQFNFQIGAFRNGVERMRAHLPVLTYRTYHHLCKLYDYLLRPIEKFLGSRRLLVVPHRALHYVPFHALSDGTSYVIQRREVCSAPSAAVLHHCLRMPRRAIQHGLFLGFSDERNPRVQDEILALASLFPESVSLLDDQATLASLNENASAAHVLHLACHGQFRLDNPLFSSLQLADGWLTVRDAYRLDLNCELVTLSACETGVSTVAPGDEWIGLARGFFSAGAPTLLASLWTADDDTTTRLMIDFYTYLRDGAQPATALRYTQCQLLAYDLHPYFWAPFVLLGRW